MGLPDHDLLIAADTGYSKALAWRLGERCCESLARGKRILVCESRQMPECRLAFSEALNLGSNRQLKLQQCTSKLLPLALEAVSEHIPNMWFLDSEGEQ